MRKPSLKQFAALAVGTITIAGASGIAFGYWTQDGSGSGSASTGTTAAVTVNQTSTLAVLYPGQEPQALSGDFDNSNPGPVKVGSVTATVDTFSSNLVDTTKPACTEDDFEISGTAAVDAEIDAGVGVGDWSGLSIQLKNTSLNQDNCKGLGDVAISYEVSPAA